MAENSAYFEAITAVRSMRVDDPFDASTETISAETQMDLARDSVGVALRDSLDTFLPYMEHLTLEDQELIKLYFLVEKPQWCLATIHRSTQTLCSQRIRHAVKRLALHAIHKGPPDQHALDHILDDHGLNKPIPGGPSTGRLIVEYRKRKSFSAVTDVLQCPRPQVRRAIISAATTLLKDEHEEHTAYGAYIHGLIDQAAVHGPGFSEAKRLKCAHAHTIDPHLVGLPRINSSDPDAHDHVLVSKAAL